MERTRREQRNASRLRRRMVMGAAAAGVATIAASAAWACTINMSGTLSVSPSSGTPGASVTITANGQVPLATYNILYLDPAAFFAGKACHTQGSNLGTATAGANGGFTTSVVVPATVGTPTTGTAQFCDQDAATNRVDGAHAYFTVT